MREEFEYDVAFSFLASDEALATQLNDRLAERVRTFIYSKAQELLSGTDGEQTFNEVFSQKTRFVAILYRNEWGQTPWTRIEETAIRNRGHEEGYDFCLLIPLDGTPPKWFPKNRIWIGLDRWGAECAAAVIESRVQELGGTPRSETLEDRAARHAREIAFGEERKQALGHYGGTAAWGVEKDKLIEALEQGVERINAGRAAHKLDFRHPIVQRGDCFVLGLKRGLSVSGRARFANSIEDAHLVATLWYGVPPMPRTIQIEPAQEYLNRQYVFDYIQPKQYVWRRVDDQSRALSTQQLAEDILTWLLDNGGEPAW